MVSDRINVVLPEFVVGWKAGTAENEIRRLTCVRDLTVSDVLSGWSGHEDDMLHARLEVSSDVTALYRVTVADVNPVIGSLVEGDEYGVRLSDILSLWADEALRGRNDAFLYWACRCLAKYGTRVSDGSAGVDIPRFAAASAEQQREELRRMAVVAFPHVSEPVAMLAALCHKTGPFREASQFDAAVTAHLYQAGDLLLPGHQDEGFLQLTGARAGDPSCRRTVAISRRQDQWMAVMTDVSYSALTGLTVRADRPGVERWLTERLGRVPSDVQFTVDPWARQPQLRTSRLRCCHDIVGVLAPDEPAPSARCLEAKAAAAEAMQPIIGADGGVFTEALLTADEPAGTLRQLQTVHCRRLPSGFAHAELDGMAHRLNADPAPLAMFTPANPYDLNADE